MLLSRTGQLSRPASCLHARPLVVMRRQGLKPLAAAGDNTDAPGSKPPRRRSSSKNAAGSNNGDVPPPSPATQLANNMASGSSSSSSGGSSAKSSGGTPPSPATQLANNLSTGSSTTPPSPAAQVASNMAAGDANTKPSSGDARSNTSSSSRAQSDDLLQQGVRAAADTAEGAIINSAAAAAGGIEAAASLTQQGLSAAEAAAEDTLRNLSAAAQNTLNAAAGAVGTAAGVVEGVGESVSSGSSSRGRGAAAMQSDDFETVNVRVPGAYAWANPTPEKGRVRDNTLTQDFDEDEVEEYKVQILAAVASLDRGLAANVREARDVDRLCRKLEDAAGPITLKWTTSRSSPNTSTMDRLAGTWRLIYSSGFNGGSLGGSRPGPPAALVPTILGQVYQVINAQAMTLDNVVELLLNYPVPQLPFLPRPEPQPTPGMRLSLHHTYEVTPPSSVKIVFESTSAKAIGPDILQSLPELGVPELPSFLKPPKDFRSATFDVTYLDKSMRITRGDRGELRIYLRDRPLSPSLPDDDIRDYE